MGELNGFLFTSLIHLIYHDDDCFFIEPKFFMLPLDLVYQYPFSFSVSLAG